MSKERKLNEALQVLADLGMPRAQRNTRTALCLLALMNLTHGKLPDVVIYMRDKNWLLLIESVTSHGPVESKRQIELARLFKGCKAGLVYVSAFPDRKTFLRYLDVIAWESEVWIADAATHMIHFNGSRFLGPY